jgi:DNA replication protein DnaC
VAAGIPKRYEHCTLDSFAPINGNRSLERALHLAREVVSRFPNRSEEAYGLLLYGPCGIGKTHLAVGVLKELIESYGVHGLFTEFSDLLRRIQQTYDRRSETPSWEVLQPALESDVLVLDDLGATRTTPWVRDTVGLIVNERYNAQRLTLITANRSPYTDDAAQQDSLADRVGERLVSRIAEMCWTVRMEGDDFRRHHRSADHRGLGPWSGHGQRS